MGNLFGNFFYAFDLTANKIVVHGLLMNFYQKSSQTRAVINTP